MAGYMKHREAPKVVLSGLEGTSCMACAMERCMVRTCDLRFPVALPELTVPNRPHHRGFLFAVNKNFPAVPTRHENHFAGSGETRESFRRSLLHHQTVELGSFLGGEDVYFAESLSWTSAS